MYSNNQIWAFRALKDSNIPLFFIEATKENPYELIRESINLFAL